MSSYKPPHSISSRMVNLVAQITEKLSLLNSTIDRDLRLRRINRIQTIHGSLAIEGNMLSPEQITAILDNKPVIGSMREIQEVRNAICAYDKFQDWNPFSIDDMLNAHKVITTGLIDECGKLRSKSVGVISGTDVIHVAPPAERVPYLISDLLGWLKQTDEHPLIAGAVFHYEFEYIHPFADGNGRIGRLWQTLFLSKWDVRFAHLPVENLIYQKQQAYYDAINKSTQLTNCSPFIEFILDAILEAINENITQETTQETTQEKVLNSIKQNSRITRNQIASEINCSPDLVKYHLHQLTKKGFIKHVGSTKAGEWVVLK